MYLTENLCLSCTHLFVDTLLNFPMPFNIILTYNNTSRVNVFRRLLVLLKLIQCLIMSMSTGTSRWVYNFLSLIVKKKKRATKALRWWSIFCYFLPKYCYENAINVVMISFAVVVFRLLAFWHRRPPVYQLLLSRVIDVKHGCFTFFYVVTCSAAKVRRAYK